MNKNILISGGTGYLGRHLIEAIKTQYDCTNIGRSENINCKNVFWDLKENIDCKLDQNFEVIIHCASIVGNGEVNKSEYIDVNVKSTLQLLELCIKNNIKKFIYISTGGVYGYGENKFEEIDRCNPIDIYSLSKHFSEQLCLLYKNKIKIIILRLFFPYGIGQSDRLFYNLASNILNKKQVVLNKNGLPIINPIHIDDVTNIIKKVIEIDCEGIYNVCGSESISIQDICYNIANAVEIDKINFVYNNNSVGNLLGNNKKINNLLKYEYKMDLNSGIHEFSTSLNSK